MRGRAREQRPKVSDATAKVSGATAANGLLGEAVQGLGSPEGPSPALERLSRPSRAEVARRALEHAGVGGADDGGADHRRAVEPRRAQGALGRRGRAW